VWFAAPRHESACKNSCLCVARILSYHYHCFLCDCMFMMFVLVTYFSVIYSPNRVSMNFLGLLEDIKVTSWFYFCIFLPYVDDEDPTTGDYLLILGSLVASMTWPTRYFFGGHQCMVRTSINLQKKIVAHSWSFLLARPIYLLINMHKKLCLNFFWFFAVFLFLILCGFRYVSSLYIDSYWILYAFPWYDMIVG
jgi:hypothetical protein